MKMSTFLQRSLALVLAFLMIASNLALEAMAGEPVFCGDENHVHAEECYINPLQDTEDAQTEEEPQTEKTTEKTQPAEEMTISTEETLPEDYSSMPMALPTNAEPAGDYVRIDQNYYPVANTSDLVDADLALLEWHAKGNNDKEGAVIVSASFDDTVTERYENVYAQVYNRLLKAPETTHLADGEKLFASGHDEELYIFAVSGMVNYGKRITLGAGQRVLVLAEDDTAIIRVYYSYDSKVPQLELKAEASDVPPAIAFQGLNSRQTLPITWSGKPRKDNVFVLHAGSIYFNYSDISKFQFRSGNSETDAAANYSFLVLPSGINCKRFVYMSNSSMTELVAQEAPGIFCKAYHNTYNGYNKQSYLYLYNNVFSNCLSTGTGDNAYGGAVIRSYAADQCHLRIKDCTFEKNKSTTTSDASGGGAIYWKSVPGDAVLTNCVFRNNSSVTVGGAIYNTGTMELYGCTFENNYAKNGGGAIAVEPPYTSSDYKSLKGVNMSGSLELDAHTVIQNNTTDGNGGAIYFNAYASQIGNPGRTDSFDIMEYEMTLNINGAQILKNKAKGNGGAIAMWLNYKDREYTSGITIQDGSIIQDNIAGYMDGEGNGGAIWMSSADDCDCLNNTGVTMSGGILDHNTATNGGAIYVATGKAGASMDFHLTGGTVTGNEASNDGGAAYIAGGNFDMSGGTIGGAGKGNTAQNGGAVYVSGGKVAGSGGSILHNQASQDGGGIYVNGGAVALSGGHVDSNTAQANGGGIAVNDGNIVMSDGYVNNNTAVTGSGGGMYVTSSEGAVHVKVYSGHIEGNTAQVSGGAVGLKGGDTSNIEVQVGVNLLHTFTEGVLTPIDHDPYTHEYCPVIKNNTSSVSGGAFYITGGAQTTLNMYCLEESGNNCPGDVDINNVHLSDFLMVEGGKVTISTAENSVCDDNDSLEHDHAHGYIKIAGSVHVAGGELDLFGSMDNPQFEQHITVDLTKQEDHYHDHRDHSNSIKLSYHENFDFNGVVDSTQTAIDLISGQEHTISDSLYKHEGYEIYGWNTDQNASPTTPDGWFDNGKTYVFIQTEGEKGNDERTYYVGKEITLYAIWEPNGYTVHYDPNVPENENYTGEEMIDQRFTYNQAQDLKVNTYGRVGYLFGGWTYIDDNKETQTLTDGQKDVINLTKVKGGTVVLKAIWTPCTEHNIEYTVTQESAKKAILTKTCTLCHRTGTVILTASDAVYDKAAHPAGVVCSDPEWFEIKNTEIEYTGVKIGKDESVENPEQTVNAGNYTATVTVDGTAASVTYRIAKATQPAPAEKPTYTEPEPDSSQLTIHPISQSDDISATTNLPTEYSARYYVDGILQDTGWIPSVKEDGKYQDVMVELTASLKYYFVYARYAGDDNYLPSPEVMANGTFLFEGDIRLTFIVDDGINYLPEDDEGNIRIGLTVHDDYYLVGGMPTVTLEDHTHDGQEILLITGLSSEGFIISKNAEVIIENEVTILVYIGNTKKMPSVTGAVEEKQVFDPIVGNSAQISRDSAYTVLYTVKNFDDTVYAQPVLKFSADIPVGTTVILQSRNAGTISYWSYKADAQTTSIPLGSFKRMGSSSDDVFALTNGDHDLQFVVDFSRTAAGCSGDTKSKLETRLSISKKIVDAGAPDLSEGAPVSVTLGSTSFELSCKSDQGLTHTLTYSFTPDGLAASKWDNRELALVISGSGLPLDAVTSATVNGTWHTCRPYSTGQYIVPIGGQYSGTIELTLKSDMFPEEGRSYALVCQLYAARSIADDAPLDGAEVCNKVNCAFVAPSREYAVKVTEAQGKHLFNSNDSITVTVDQTVATGYMLKVQLQHKDQGTDVYVNTGRRADVTGAEYTFSLNGSAAGSYRVVAIVERDDGLAVAEIPYYFIIQ